MTRLLWAALLLVLPRCLVAQNNPEAVYKIRSTDLNIRFEGTTPSITEHCQTEKIFYSNFNKYGHESVFFSDLYPLLNIKAETLPPDANGKKTKVSTYETKDLVQAGIFYGGNKRKDFVYPNLATGSIGRLEYSRTIKDLRIILPFYFESNIPVKFASFSVTFPENMNVRYMLLGARKKDVKFEERTVGNRKQMTWTLADIAAFESQKKAPPYRYYETHIVLLVESYEINQNHVQVLDNVSNLFNWYNALLDEVPHTGEYTLLDKMTDEIAPSQDAPIEKTKNIYRWVQQHIKYIAFENGMAGFVPREPSDVFQKRYGDCKDMATLLTYMLNHAGIKAYQAWIGTRDIPYTYEEVPSPASSNHMICSAKLDTTFIFLDATDPYAAFGKPSGFIQGKEALVRISRTGYKIIKVPVMDPKENQRIDSISVWIEPDGVGGKVISKLTGYKKSDFKIQQLKAEINPKAELIRDFFGVGENNIRISNVVMNGLDDPNGPLTLTFEFYQPGYYKSVGEKLYVNLNFVKSTPGEKVDESRSQMIEANYRFTDKAKTYFTLPSGYAVQSLPKNVDVRGSFYLATASYQSDLSTITYEKTVASDYLYLDNPDFLQWNNFVQAVTDINRESIVLTRLK